MLRTLNSRRLYRFGPFEVDIQDGELRKGGIRIRLQDQPFRILALLLSRAGEVVTREEIRETIWPGEPLMDVEHGLASAVNKLRAALSDSAQTPRFVETLHRRGFRFVAPLEAGSDGWTPPARSLAVLPLENLRHDPEEEYFCDGMTDALTTKLASIGSLRVVSRMSVLSFKSIAAPVADVARRLNVAYVVEGTVLREDDQVRVTVQLIDAAEDRHVWANIYQGDMGGIIELQNRVSKEIAREVNARLTTVEEERLSRAAPVIREAYEACLRGRFYHGLWTNVGLEKSLDYFHRAIEADPDYAPAYVGLVMAYRDMVTFGMRAGSDVLPPATAAAERALELDDQLADAYYARGCCNGLAWLWDQAEADFRRAIELNPGLSVPHHALTCFVLMPQGRFEEAIREMHRALELSPLALDHKEVLAHVYWYKGELGSAMMHIKDALTLAPEFPANLLYLATFLSAQGHHEEAITVVKKVDGVPNLSLPHTAHLLANAGRTEEARQALDRALELSKGANVAPCFLAMAYSALGEYDEAFRWLEKGAHDHDLWMMLLAVDPRFERLRSDSKFHDLLQRMNLE